MRAQGWPDSGSVGGGHWQGRGRINSERRKGTEWGKTAQPSPALGPGPERCLMRSWVVQAGGQAGQAGVADSPCARAREIWHFTHSRYSDG